MYDSDRVIELVPTPREKCISPMGRHIGLEPVLLYSVWLPTKDEIPGRPVEGFYVLRDIPSATTLSPAPFHRDHPEQAVESFGKIKYVLEYK